MQGFILGAKSDTVQHFDESGMRVPATTIITQPCYLVDIKTEKKDGYCAVLLGFGETRRMSKPNKGKLDKAGVKTPLRFLREVRVADAAAIIDQDKKKAIKINGTVIAVGDKMTPSALFKKNDRVSVVGISKGKGFAGVVKRHHFRGGPRTHGQSDRERAPGSIGQTTTPGRVYKGKRMAGRMGGDRVTIRGLTVVDTAEDRLIVKGLVPGARKGLLIVKSSS